MAQILVRQLDEDVKAALQRRARSNGRSTEEEVREILRDAVCAEPVEVIALGSAIASQFRGLGLADVEFERRGHPARGVEFDSP